MSDDMDEIWSLFADDGGQAIEAMETALQALRGNAQPADPGHVAALFRAVHTFKGNARVLGLAVIESRAHLAEDLIGLVRDRGAPLDTEMVDLLFLAMDTLGAMLESVERDRADADPAASEHLMRRLQDKFDRTEAILDGRTPENAAPPPAAEPEPIPPAEAETPAKPQTSAALPATARPEPVSGLLADEGYRTIFGGMVQDCSRAIEARLADPDAPDPGSAVAGLAHAAGQLGLTDWRVPLDRYLSLKGAEVDDMAELMLALSVLSARDLERASQTSGVLARLVPHVETLLDIERAGPAEGAADQESLERAISACLGVLDAEHYPRAADAAVAVARGGYAALSETLPEFLTELVAIERVEGAPATSLRSLLERISAARIIDTLARVVECLRAFRAGKVDDGTFSQLQSAMLGVFHACQSHRLESPARLTMSLLDLFARTHATGRADPILTRIAQTYVDAMERIFAVIDRGEVPDMARIDDLLGEAESAGFTAAGLVGARTIERRLGLPESFHRVLSPESVRTAMQALEAGKHFFVVRADINDDDTLAEAFMEWLTGQTAITNVTVIDGERTLFDFLLAGTNDDSALATQLAALDGGRGRLVLLHTLADAGSAEETTPETQPDPLPEVGLSLGLVEAIGEVSAAQATVHHLMIEVSQADIGNRLARALRGEGLDPALVSRVVSDVWQPFEERLQRAVHAEALVNSQLMELQETAVAHRTRPAGSILRPLGLMVQAGARRRGGQVAYSFAGDDLMLDASLLETLRDLLRAVLALRFEGASALPRAVHISLASRQEDVAVTLDETGCPPLDPAVLAPFEAEVRRRGGILRNLAKPGEGARMLLSLPRSMVVLEGMVIAVGSIRYVVPIESVSHVVQIPAEAVLSVSAGDGQRMIRLRGDDLATMAVLPGGAHSDPAQSRDVFLIVRSRDTHLAVPVDALLGQQLVLLRPLQGVLAGHRHLSGVALLAGGEVGMVLSMSALADFARTPAGAPIRQAG